MRASERGFAAVNLKPHSEQRMPALVANSVIDIGLRAGILIAIILWCQDRGGDRHLLSGGLGRVMKGGGVTAQAQRNPIDGTLRAAELLREARHHERAGRLAEAMDCCVAAIAEAAWSGAWAAQAVGLRRLAVLHHQRGEPTAARETCRTGYEVALAAGDSVLAAEALNALAGFELECGNLTTARAAYQQALALGRESEELRARIEQNLGTLANVQGDLVGALEHYQRSLETYQGSTSDHQCALAYHDLGMASADRGEWEQADRFFRQSRAIAEAEGDVHLQGLCTLPHAES